MTYPQPKIGALYQTGEPWYMTTFPESPFSSKIEGFLVEPHTTCLLIDISGPVMLTKNYTFLMGEKIGYTFLTPEMFEKLFGDPL